MSDFLKNMSETRERRDSRPARVADAVDNWSAQDRERLKKIVEAWVHYKATLTDTDQLRSVDERERADRINESERWVIDAASELQGLLPKSIEQLLDDDETSLADVRDELEALEAVLET